MRYERESIAETIAEVEANLAHLDEQRQYIICRLQPLRVQMNDLDSSVNSTKQSTLTPTEKISLFRSLFRGRNDVYPKLWATLLLSLKFNLLYLRREGNQLCKSAIRN